MKKDTTKATKINQYDSFEELDDRLEKPSNLIWQNGDQWCCYQKGDIKVFSTREQAMEAANRSVGAQKASITRKNRTNASWEKFRQYKSGSSKLVTD